MSKIVPAPDDPGCFVVLNGETEQSFVDPNDPTRLEFEYVQRIAEILDVTVLARPRSEPVRVVHVGGGGFTVPRYIQAKRPGTAQTVFEPDEQLIEDVRRELPLNGRTSIQIRPTDGLTGMSAMAGGWVDALIVDAFNGAQVPAELATTAFFAEALRLLRTEGVLIMNITDTAPFEWSKRCLAGLVQYAPNVGVIAEVPVWKGRRFGNLIVVAGADIPVEALSRQLAAAAFPQRLVGGEALLEWLQPALPFTRADAEPSPEPNWGKTWFGPRRHKGDSIDDDSMDGSDSEV
ncbi:spermidine synthase [Propionicimonas sp.]|uniref:spermidine synthase n=1 Tax=Propionicimonas sp. TaxID=1955623 RepID=UPI001829B4FD|nr:fused MFS/spermidine synthase [Propionicimonas sp.]MBU3976597.1 fused MFS/spermidine synthase [Actinomycetota bacterium]MBA3020403.1 spermidine synthase [Propionicimonas sp.]MBU3986576.1 fused MFS/spermidine synthase [Actinomycetota bacterium]MBU4007272.1 fused MFS/spermidine synthase [Actinomycetota bacterium]MBU4065025.1 fused MFS/spermidine synthase [Actinomycetota bacterium]